MRVPSWSFKAGRISAQRDAATTTCTPKERPCAASAMTDASRFANSCRNVDHPVDDQERVAVRILRRRHRPPSLRGGHFYRAGGTVVLRSAAVVTTVVLDAFLENRSNQGMCYLRGTATPST